MKTNTFFSIAMAAAFSIAAPVALAQSNSAAPLSRAEVVAQLHAAQADGTMMPAGEGWGPENTPQAVSHAAPLSRATVKAQTRAAEEAGTLPAPGEAPVFSTAAAPSTLSRAEVKAETRDVIRNGTIGGAAYYPGGPKH